MRKVHKLSAAAIILLLSSGIMVTSGLFATPNDPMLILALALSHGVAILALFEKALGKNDR
jgi:hypothetical protein